MLTVRSPGMVGYTESLTDPSYEGQILILTYPLVGNYGVPDRSTPSLEDLPVDFESSRIHVAAVIVGYYSEDYSHYLANSSLGTWLKESGVPAIYGVDTRALTKKIREKGSMLGKVLARSADSLPGSPPTKGRSLSPSGPSWRDDFIDIPFADPNLDNLVAVVSTPLQSTSVSATSTVPLASSVSASFNASTIVASSTVSSTIVASSTVSSTIVASSTVSTQPSATSTISPTTAQDIETLTQRRLSNIVGALTNASSISTWLILSCSPISQFIPSQA